MLSLFRNNHIITGFFVFIYGILLLLPVFFLPTAKSLSQLGSLANWIPEEGAGANLLFLLLAFVLSFGLNQLINRFRLGRQSTYFVAISSLLMLALFPGALTLSPVLLANLSLLLSCYNLYRSYEQKNSVLPLSNAALFMGLSIELYLPFAFYIPAFILAWITIRPASFKDFMVILLSGSIPAFLIGTLYYLFDQWSVFAGLHAFSNWLIQDFSNLKEPFTLAALGASALILLLSWANFQTLKQKTTIKEQKFLQIIFILLFFAPLQLLTYQGIPSQLTALAFPMALLLGLQWQAWKNSRWAELWHLLLLTIAALSQYYPLF
ncbi:hypothetical protein PPO43_12485 [Saprospira sp. CCB-QB6]|uniref:hypothetical protein n=1 Tax=Saprospira sp. CCB-QB6 TaxID=3023936 RepID=UPI00234BC93D|nr:hypothetical protein [Saprospira sp. CCB-QB6]WCL80788.1 hypothetical protein PPO43_12485 [Saprospira sp. CCB-QB6]